MTSSYDFPDFFNTKAPIETHMTRLPFGDSSYWMSTVATEGPRGAPGPFLRPYEDNEDGTLNCDEFEEDFDITLSKSGKFMTSFYVPASLLSFIIGARGSRLKSLQKSTNTTIKIPKINEKGDIKILGETERNVAMARTQINLFVFQKKEKMPATHFVSIRIHSGTIETNFLKFKEKILQDPPRGITESTFQNPKKLHLTITVLTLLDDEETELAKRTLQACYDEHISHILPKKHPVTLRGVEIMNDDPSEVQVLYAKVSNDDKLQGVADQILKSFSASGLVRKQYERVKLHVTLMNVSFAKLERSFDASDILEEFRDFYFGQVTIDRLELSVRFTKGEDGYYESILSLEV